MIEYNRIIPADKQLRNLDKIYPRLQLGESFKTEKGTSGKSKKDTNERRASHDTV
ncbi:hypothetical protein B14911_26835 [Bacillus sp. NRRL B-14911]|uniref:Uncharacterized protein n=1 Tax=Bacillus infantis NRRL B-14911 TaxID=1367477 RepID=U5L9R9_9BACI|nr:hypothetical protein N288_13435 [Bacillus infantis NRRL B-14911]EAR68344.1 hypothetical protein B14911_26835 [Bacillus sp. NRRL B-14911]